MPAPRPQLLLANIALTLLAHFSAHAGQLVEDKFESTTLGRTLPMSVYLPKGYATSNVRYPVVYLLHGAGGDQHDWSRGGGVAETLDGLIQRGLIRPWVVVMPSAGPQSWWIDAAAQKAETAVISELLPFVNTKYRTLAQRNATALAGASAGGYGALNLALKHPQRFCAAGLISAATYDPEPPAESSARSAAQFQENGQFSPALWKAHSHRAQLNTYANAPQKVSMWIVSADHDHLGIAIHSAKLFEQLRVIQPRQVKLRIVDGDHDTMTFRDALPDTLRYLDQECAKAP